MNKWTTLASTVAVAAALFAAAACAGQGAAAPTPTLVPPSTVTAAQTSVKSPIDGLCLPAVPLAVSVGDTWRISGPAKDPEGMAPELPAGATEVSRTFTVDAIGTTTYAGGRGDLPIEHPTIRLKGTIVTRDADGKVLSSEDDPRAARGGWTPASVANLSPALTPDWECHRKAWLDGWPQPAQPSIGERVLSSGVTAIVFTVSRPLSLPDLGIEATTEAHHGYDRLTGRVVLQETRSTGTRNGEPFTTEMLLELALGGSTTSSPGTGGGGPASPEPGAPVSPPPAQKQVTAGLSGEAPGDTAPPIPHGTPMLSLSYEGAVYYAKALSRADAASLNVNDLELVGVTTESNLLFPAGSEIGRFIVDLNHDNPQLTLSDIKDRIDAKFQIGVDESAIGRVLQGGLTIYRLKNGQEGYVYTFEPGQSKVNPEDGQIFEFPAVWMRWAAADSNGT